MLLQHFSGHVERQVVRVDLGRAKGKERVNIAMDYLFYTLSLGIIVVVVVFLFSQYSIARNFLKLRNFIIENSIRENKS